MIRINKNKFRDWLFGLPVALDALLSIAFSAFFFILFALVLAIPLDGDWLVSSAIPTAALAVYGLWLRRVYRRQHGMSPA